ncbi:L,D-transpeptidase family protein [Bacillus sp. FJAT-44742]|uniref:L,D-transpeptidase family protein n=1 Tax=Bacillus sp. FJAT-44742 TaxID=2014005 RepID=UPI000C23A27D|nr:peptidoglycan-binding protein [Bacillus sp. FJAT-44742]
MKKVLACILVGLLFLLWQVPTTSASTGQMIVINKATNQLAFYESNKLVRTFSVATGRSSNLTPEGKHKVVNKIVNRPYYKGNIAGGDPKNPLGKRWIGLNARGTNGNTYAIHGNNNPSSIGTYASAGCVRMHNNEVEWLFSRVKVNTPVVITTSSQSFDTIAKNNGYKINGSSSPSSPGGTTSGTLKRGSKGEAVKEIQRQLSAAGYKVSADGIFGKGTEDAVKKFQKANKLKADGVVGTQTKNLLANQSKTVNKSPSTSTQIKSGTLRKGSSGSEVKKLQQKLTSLGFNTRGADGKFGPATEAAVKSFQKANKLKVDGVAGPQTIKVINSK